jgi:glyoxylase-like metal-dependent hydrolase (beta-lactamase superfamily II)
MERVAGPIHRVPLGFVSAYLVEADGGPVLVDTGVAGRARVLLDAGREVASATGAGGLAHVLVTHCHPDHAGSLATVVAATGVPVHAHGLDAAVIRAGGPQPPTIPEARLLRLLGPLIGRAGPRGLAPAPVEVELDDGATTPGGLLAIHTPGHTPGHLSFLWPGDGGVLIAGDAASNLFGRLGLAVVDADPAVARQSFERLAGLDFETACFGHGRVLRGRASAAFRRRIDRLVAGR